MRDREGSRMTTAMSNDPGSSTDTTPRDNDQEAVDQNGLQAADIVYEYVAEGGITRLTAMFQNAPDLIGPMRSARFISLKLGRHYKGLLFQSGESQATRSRAAQDPTPQFFDTIGYQYRTSARYAPDNLMISGDKVRAAEGLFGLGAYTIPKARPNLSGGTAVNAFNVDEHYSTYSYDSNTNLSTVAVTVRDYALADRHLESGIAYCRQRDMDSWVLYMTGWKSASELDQGRWDAAADSATVVLDDPAVSAVSRITPLAVIGRLRARRGDPDPWTPLDDGLELAEGTGELQRLAPVAVARAEARWLDGEPDRIGAETAAALTLALEQEEPWASGELWAWGRNWDGNLGVGSDEEEVLEPRRVRFVK